MFNVSTIRHTAHIKARSSQTLFSVFEVIPATAASILGLKSGSLNYGKQRHFRVCSRLKIIIDANFDDAKEMNNGVPVLTSSEMRNVMKRLRSYLDAYFNGEMDNNVD
ncbi:hypothetical protein TNCV_1499132 [Trichonephila clavipes]|nr:hypothetical protein TNCV_1499132 [Trichonephila clavipes]